MLIIKTERIIPSDPDDISIKFQNTYKFLGIPVLTTEHVFLVLPQNDENLYVYMHQRSAKTVGTNKENSHVG